MLFNWAHQVDCPVKFLNFILYEFLYLSIIVQHVSLISLFLIFQRLMFVENYKF